MKKVTVIAISLLLTSMIAGCTNNVDTINNNDATSTPAESDASTSSDISNETDTNDVIIQASNLTDESSREELDTIMKEAGVSDERRTVFWNHVDQFNQCEGITGLTDGYEYISATEPKYDVYDLQDAWEQQYPDFVGYNCRITAFGLMGDYISVQNYTDSEHTDLFLDEEALQADGSALFNDDDLEAFYTLFDTIEGENTNDSARQAELVSQAWEKFGIQFDDSVPMSLISIFFHDQFSEDDNELMIGHTGVLFDRGEDGLFFVEKLAFQLPYQVVKFANRDELKDYLMGLYDVDSNQPTAKPFIFENGAIMN